MNTSKQIHESGSESSNTMNGIQSNFNNFEVIVDVVIMGSNPENSDYENRSGAIRGFASYVRASNEYGDTRTQYVSSSLNEAEAKGDAQRLADALNARLRVLGRLPVGFDKWCQGRPVYGSQAYIDYGRFDDIAVELMEGDI